MSQWGVRFISVRLAGLVAVAALAHHPVHSHAQEMPYTPPLAGPTPPSGPPIGVMERPPENEPAPPPPPVEPRTDHPAEFAGSGATQGSFKTPEASKVRWMKRVPGPECTTEQWATGKWYKGPHEHNFGWYWVVNGVYYSYAKPKARVPDYATRTVIVYDDDFKTGAIKVKKAPGAIVGPAPASVATSPTPSASPAATAAAPLVPAPVRSHGPRSPSLSKKAMGVSSPPPPPPASHP